MIFVLSLTCGIRAQIFRMTASTDTLQTVRSLSQEGYKYGFVTDIESETAPKGLSEDTVRFISAKKNEPEWLLEWRLKAYRHWLTMKEPAWAEVHYPKIDYNGIIYYSAPKPKKKLASMDEVDPEVRATFEKLGIPLEEQKMLSNVAMIWNDFEVMGWETRWAR